MNEAAIQLHIEKLAGGRFLATSADVPGLVAEGRSVAEATEIAQGLARKIAEPCIEHGDPLPPALTLFTSLLVVLGKVNAPDVSLRLLWSPPAWHRVHTGRLAA